MAQHTDPQIKCSQEYKLKAWLFHFQSGSLLMCLGIRERTTKLPELLSSIWETKMEFKVSDFFKRSVCLLRFIYQNSRSKEKNGRSEKRGKEGGSEARMEGE